MNASFKVKAIGEVELLNDELKKLINLVDGEAIKGALKVGAELVQANIQEKVTSRIKNRAKSKGNLAKSIVYKIGVGRGEKKDGVATFYWDDIVVRTRRSNKESKSKRYAGPTSTATYGPILENDDKRILRHLEEGFEEVTNEVESAMLSVIQNEIGKAVKG